MPNINLVDAAKMSEEKPKKKNWIKSAIPEKNKGKFAAKAKDAGKSTQAFAKDHEGDKDQPAARVL